MKVFGGSLLREQKKILCFLQGLLFNYGRVLCMQALGDHRLAIGTQLGKVWLFDTVTCKILHSSAQLEDAVLCMNIYK